MMAMMILMMSLRGRSARVVARVPRARSADRCPRKRRGRDEEGTHDPVKGMLAVLDCKSGDWLLVLVKVWLVEWMWIAEMRWSDSSGQAAFMYADCEPESSTHATQELNASAQ